MVFRVCAINKVTQCALVALFVHRLSPGVGGLIKRQKIGWKPADLIELMTVGENSGARLEKKSTKLLGL